MYRLFFRYHLFTLFLFALMSCQGLAPQAVQSDVDRQPQREDPFQMRAYTPVLDSAWLGHAIAYGCYREGQAPGVKGPTEAEILEDLQILLPHWQMIRVYGADEDSERILKVIREHKLPIRMQLGIWLENETNNPQRHKANMEQALKGIELANTYAEEVIAINVGNETQVDWSYHRMDINDLVRYIRLVREQVSQPVTTADDYNFWNKEHSMQVADEIDFIMLHAYPLWNGKTLDIALHWMDSVYTSTHKRFSRMPMIMGEVGWGTAYDPSRMGPGEEGSLIKGEISIEAQETFLRQLHSWTEENQVPTFWFEAFDEPWKGGGEAVSEKVLEKHWGLYTKDRQPKASTARFFSEIN